MKIVLKNGVINQILVFMLLAFLLSGCATLESRVQVYHQDDMNLQNKSYAFIPIIKVGQLSNLEYDYYAKIISDNLNRYGLYKTSDVKLAQLCVTFFYFTGQGTQNVGMLPIYGQTGIASSYTSGYLSNFGSTATYSGYTQYTPSYGVVGATPFTYTTYPHVFAMNIHNASDLKRKNFKPIYSVIVSNNNGVSDISSLLPYMIEAAFNKFPETNGSDRFVSVRVK